MNHWFPSPHTSPAARDCQVHRAPLLPAGWRSLWAPQYAGRHASQETDHRPGTFIPSVTNAYSQFHKCSARRDGYSATGWCWL